MNTVQQLEKKLHSHYLTMLNLYRYVQQTAFRQAYELASEEEKEVASKIIEKLDRLSLQIWTKKVLIVSKHYELLDTRYLRELAQQHGIRGYATMDKVELVSYLNRNNGSAADGSGKDFGTQGENGPMVSEVRSFQGGDIREAV